MNTEVPWIRWSFDDYLGDTRDLSLIEKGAYSDLLNRQYERGVLPLDISRVQRLVGTRGTEEDTAVEFVLQRYFEKTKDGYSNPRVAEELEWSIRSVEQRRNAGKKGGQTNREDKRPPKQPLNREDKRSPKQPLNREDERPPKQPLNREDKQPSKQPLNRDDERPPKQPLNREDKQPSKQPLNRDDERPPKQPLNRVKNYNGGPPLKGGPPNVIPPKKSEVQEYATGQGCPHFDVEKWFSYYSDEKRKWHLSNGKKMTNWQSSIRFWIGKNYPGSTKHRRKSLSERIGEENESILQENEGFEAPSLMEVFKDKENSKEEREEG